MIANGWIYGLVLPGLTDVVHQVLGSIHLSIVALHPDVVWGVVPCVDCDVRRGTEGVDFTEKQVQCGMGDVATVVAIVTSRALIIIDRYREIYVCICRIITYINGSKHTVFGMD